MEAFASTLVARELPKPRVTKLLDRGEYDMPVGEPLQPGVPVSLVRCPRVLPPTGSDLLTGWFLEITPWYPACWSTAFGSGFSEPAWFGLRMILVCKANNPLTPSSSIGWPLSSKREVGILKTLRLLVMSKTFRQSSTYREDLPDPANLLYGRGPRYRLDAEVLRDMALWSSGLLDPTMGGEGVKPYQPPGMWKELMHPASNTKNYAADKGQRLYRRSLYVYWKR